MWGMYLNWADPHTLTRGLSHALQCSCARFSAACFLVYGHTRILLACLSPDGSALPDGACTLTDAAYRWTPSPFSPLGSSLTEADLHQTSIASSPVRRSTTQQGRSSRPPSPPRRPSSPPPIKAASRSASILSLRKRSPAKVRSSHSRLRLQTGGRQAQTYDTAHARPSAPSYTLRAQGRG